MAISIIEHRPIANASEGWYAVLVKADDGTEKVVALFLTQGAAQRWANDNYPGRSQVLPAVLS